MSEEETIEILETLSCYGLSLKITDENIKAIDTILDLYKQEKEKNKELEEENQSYRDYYGTPPCYDDAKYIKKSKVERIVKELEKRCIYPEKTSWYAGLTVGEALFIKGFLKRELLEEE